MNLQADLSAKTALVTGAGKGLGRAIAKALAVNGARVYAVARTEADLLALAAEQPGIVPLVGDVLTDEFITAVAALGPIDLLVNNAGSNQPEPMSAVEDETLDRLIDLNIRSVYRLSRTVSRSMPDGGSIIHMSSQMAHVGAANRTVYCMTKAALEGLCKAMAVELGPRGIRVNTLCPTFVLTEMTRGFFDNPEFAATVDRMIAVPGLPTPEHVAAGALYLCSDAAAYVTGTALKVDGGWTAA